MRYIKALLLFFLSLIFVACGQSQPNEVLDDSSEESVVIEETPTTDEVVGSVTIRSIGDILIHDTVYAEADTGNGYDFNGMFDNVRPYLTNADITTANLEMITASSLYPPTTYPAFNAPEEILGALKASGVDIVNNATNHSLDYGTEGVYASLDTLDRYEMPYVGSYRDWQDYNTPRILEKNGVKVGFLSYANDANGNYVPEGDEAHVLSLIDLELIDLEVKQLKELVDVVVVIFHNGEEYSYLPNNWQLEVMQVARDAGANFILGGHPHVLQPYIYYNDSQLALASHGNFLTGQYELDTKIGGISEVTFDKLGDGSVKIASVRFMPTYNLGMPETTTNTVMPLVDAEGLGIGDVASLFNEIQLRMRSYTNQVEVVDYLD